MKFIACIGNVQKPMKPCKHSQVSRTIQKVSDTVPHLGVQGYRPWKIEYVKLGVNNADSDACRDMRTGHWTLDTGKGTLALGSGHRTLGTGDLSAQCLLQGH